MPREFWRAVWDSLAMKRVVWPASLYPAYAITPELPVELYPPPQGPRHRQSRRMHWHEGAPLCSIKRPRNGGAKRPPKRGNGTRSLLILVGRCAHMALAVSMEVRVDFACCEAPLSRTRPGPVPDLTQVSHGGTITCRVGDRLSGCTPSRPRRSATR